MLTRKERRFEAIASSPCGTDSRTGQPLLEPPAPRKRRDGLADLAVSLGFAGVASESGERPRRTEGRRPDDVDGDPLIPCGRRLWILATRISSGLGMDSVSGMPCRARSPAKCWQSKLCTLTCARSPLSNSGLSATISTIWSANSCVNSPQSNSDTRRSKTSAFGLPTVFIGSPCQPSPQICANPSAHILRIVIPQGV